MRLAGRVPRRAYTRRGSRAPRRDLEGRAKDLGAHELGHVDGEEGEKAGLDEVGRRC